MNVIIETEKDGIFHEVGHTDDFDLFNDMKLDFCECKKENLPNKQILLKNEVGLYGLANAYECKECHTKYLAFLGKAKDTKELAHVVYNAEEFQIAVLEEEGSVH